MLRDPFVEAAEAVAVAGRVARDAIQASIDALDVGVRARTAGVPLVDIVDDLISAGGRDVRLAAGDAFHEFERAVVDLRAQVVRTLVEDDGLSLTEVGARLQVSRQAVARLYAAARRDGPMSSPRM